MFDFIYNNIFVITGIWMAACAAAIMYGLVGILFFS